GRGLRRAGSGWHGRGRGCPAGRAGRSPSERIEPGPGVDVGSAPYGVAMTWIGWVAIAAALIAVVAVVLAVQNRRTLARRAAHWHPSGAAGRGAAGPGPGAEATDHQLVAFVANPTKPGVPALRDAAVQACA